MSERLTPDWWRDRLLDALIVRNGKNAELNAYYSGTYAPPVVSERYSAAYQNLIRICRTPWARLIVDTISERLHVTGIKMDDEESGAFIWDVLRANYIDADQSAVHAEALITGTGYVSVWKMDSGGIRVTPESSGEVIHESVPGDPRSIAAAVKVFPDDLNGVWRCELYLPDVVYTYAGPPPPKGFTGDAQQVFQSEKFEKVSAVANPFGIVPVTPFVNRARVGSGSFSELDDLIPVLRRIDKITLDMLSSSDAAGFRQKWATGLEIPRNPDTGQPIEPFDAAVSRLWVSESEATRFGSFEATDLGPYMKVISDSVASLAAISRVPAHYLMTDLVNPPSADSLVASESGLVAKVRDRQSTFGQSWERVAGLVATGVGGVGITPLSEVVWGDAERRSESQVADALIKMATLGVPQEALWAEWGADPATIVEWRAKAAAEAIRSAAVTPTEPEDSENG